MPATTLDLGPLVRAPLTTMRVFVAVVVADTHGGAAALSGLAVALDLDRATVAHELAWLVGHGYVRRLRKTGDLDGRHGYYYRVTGAALAAIAELDAT